MKTLGYFLGLVSVSAALTVSAAQYHITECGENLTTDIPGATVTPVTYPEWRGWQIDLNSTVADVGAWYANSLRSVGDPMDLSVRNSISLYYGIIIWADDVQFPGGNTYPSTRLLLTDGIRTTADSSYHDLILEEICTGAVPEIGSTLVLFILSLIGLAGIRRVRLG